MPLLSYSGGLEDVPNDEYGHPIDIDIPTHPTLLGVCPTIRSWRRKTPRNNLLTEIWTLSWSY